MPFDIQGAKREGYTDTEIADYLASQRKFDATGARKEGYGDTEIIAHLATPERPFIQKAADFLTMGHAYPEPTYAGSELTPEGKLDPRVKTGDPGFFQDPVTALAMGGAAGVRAASRPLLAAGREALGWFTGGGSEVLALAKAGVKGIVKAAEVPNLAATATARAGKPFAEVPIQMTGDAMVQPASRVAAEVAPRIASPEIVQPGATSGGKPIKTPLFGGKYEVMEPPIPEGRIRLYRGEPNKPPTWSEEVGKVVAPEELRGQWFTPDKNYAFYYASDAAGEFPSGAKLAYIDVPANTDLTRWYPRGSLGKNELSGKELIVPKTESRNIKYSEIKPTAKEIVEPGAASGGVSPNSIIPEVKGGATGELPKYAEGSAINLERLNTTEDVRQFINERTKAAEKTIGKRKVTWEETRLAAEQLGWDEKAIRKEWNRKGSFTAAEIDATRQTNLNAITDLQKAIKDLPYDQTTLPPELRAKVLDAMGLIKVTSQAASEAGRALNIHKRVLSNDPEFRATSEFNRALNAIAGKGGKRTDDLINRLKDIDFDDTAAVNRLVYDATKTRWEKLTDGAFELWINGLLSNPLTHVVNTTSNALTLAYTYPERLLATGIEAARSKLTGTPRGMFFGETAQDVFSISKGLTDAVKRFGTAMKKGDLANKLDYRPTALPEGLAKILPTRALIAEDAFFKGFIENAELNRLAYRQAVQGGLKGEAFKNKVVDLLANPTEEMLEAAAKRGKYLTYQKELGATGNLIFRARETVPGLKYFIPFVKTPLNIAKFSLERSPLYLPIAISKAMKGELKGAQLSEQLAKPLMGTMLGVTTYQLAEQGYITGGTPQKKGERDEKLATGWQPYSVKVGDSYYSFARLEPLGTILGMAADMSQIKTQMKENDKFNAAAAITGSITTNLANKTFMQGFSNLIQGIADPGRYGANVVKQLAGSAIPAVSGGIARAIDPNVRDTRSIADTMQSRIPGVAESLPPKLTVWGDPIERPGSPVGRFISPMQISKAKGSPIEKEMTRLDLDIGYPSRKIGNVELNPDEYWQMVQQGSKPAKIMLDALSQSSTWKAKSAYEKERDIRMVVDRYRKPVHEQMVMNLVKSGRLKPENEKEMMYIYNQLK